MPQEATAELKPAMTSQPPTAKDLPPKMAKQAIQFERSEKLSDLGLDKLAPSLNQAIQEVKKEAVNGRKRGLELIGWKELEDSIHGFLVSEEEQKKAANSLWKLQRLTEIKKQLVQLGFIENEREILEKSRLTELQAKLENLTQTKDKKNRGEEIPTQDEKALNKLTIEERGKLSALKQEETEILSIESITAAIVSTRKKGIKRLKELTSQELKMLDNPLIKERKETRDWQELISKAEMPILEELSAEETSGQRELNSKTIKVLEKLANEKRNYLTAFLSLLENKQQGVFRAILQQKEELLAFGQKSKKQVLEQIDLDVLKRLLEKQEQTEKAVIRTKISTENIVTIAEKNRERKEAKNQVDKLLNSLPQKAKDALLKILNEKISLLKKLPGTEKEKLNKIEALLEEWPELETAIKELLGKNLPREEQKKSRQEQEEKLQKILEVEKEKALSKIKATKEAWSFIDWEILIQILEKVKAKMDSKTTNEP